MNLTHFSDSISSTLTPVMSSTGQEADLNESLGLLDLDGHVSGPPAGVNLLEVTDDHLTFADPAKEINRFDVTNDTIHDNHQTDNDGSRSLFPFDSDLSDTSYTDSEPSVSSSSSDSDFDLPRPKRPKIVQQVKKSKKAHKLTCKPKIDQRPNGSLFNTTVVENLELVELGRTQKGQLLLFVKSHDSLKQLTIAAGGINKQSIKWRCSKRDCSGDVVTQISDNLIKPKESESGKRKRFELISPSDLTIDHLEPLKHKKHDCQQLHDSSMIINKIVAEAKNIIDKKVQLSKDDARSLLPRQVIREATSVVMKTLDKEEIERNRINADTFKLPRRIYRIIKAYKPTQTDFVHDNLSQFVLPPSFSEGSYKIDEQFARATENNFLLFSSPEIKWLNDPETVLICDGTFPLKKKLKTFSQMWILYTIHPQGSQMAAFCFMRNRKEESYRLVLRHLKDILGKLEVHRIIMDREAAENNATQDLIKHKDFQNCYFHILQMWFRPLKKHVGSYIPSARKKPTCDNSKIITRIWAHCRLLPYFPLTVSASYVELLKEKAESISDPTAQSRVNEFLNKIRNDLTTIPSISWWSVLNSGEKPVWKDTTSNRLERFNLEIKQYVNNFCTNKDKTVEVICSILEFAEQHRDHSLVFNLNQVGRKPSLKIRQRRKNIEELLELLTLSNTSREKLDQVYALVEELSL